MPLKVLITGATGMLGHAVVQAWVSRFSIFATASRQAVLPLDTIPFFAFPLESWDYSPLAEFCSPDVVVNCAALTDHQLCSVDPKRAQLINTESPANLARAFPYSYIIHISTDAVFASDAVFPDENILPIPFSTYGETKYGGEQQLLRENKNALAIRTTIVGTGGRRLKPSLAEWILDELSLGHVVSLYTDAVFTPINVWDFVSILEWCVMHRPQGVLHAAGADRISKYEFGSMLATQCGFDEKLIRPCLLSESRSCLGRRFDQSISSRRLEQLRGVSLPGARECVAGIARRI